MTRKSKRSAAGDALDLMRFGFDAWSVMALRIAKIAAGGPAATVEAQRMISEKATAAIEAQVAAGLALVGGHDGAAAGNKALAVYKKHVRANRRRLSRGA